MKCAICKEKIVLSPSATERALKVGGRPQDFTKLFITHTHCTLNKRKLDTLDLIERIVHDQARLRLRIQ